MGSVEIANDFAMHDHFRQVFAYAAEVFADIDILRLSATVKSIVSHGNCGNPAGHFFQAFCDVGMRTRLWLSVLVTSWRLFFTR